MRYFVGVPSSCKGKEQEVAWSTEDGEQALAFLHSRFVVHADVKPENILLRIRLSGIQAALGDFGLAQDALQHLKDDVGTDDFKAPGDASEVLQQW